jgi:hypothetical protein
MQDECKDEQKQDGRGVDEHCQLGELTTALMEKDHWNVMRYPFPQFLREFNHRASDEEIGGFLKCAHTATEACFKSLKDARIKAGGGRGEEYLPGDIAYSENASDLHFKVHEREQWVISRRAAHILYEKEARSFDELSNVLSDEEKTVVLNALDNLRGWPYGFMGHELPGTGHDPV